MIEIKIVLTEQYIIWTKFDITIILKKVIIWAAATNL